MNQPEELKKSEPLIWSTGIGTNVWAMFCAAISGDLETVKQLVRKDPSIVRCHYAYRTPLYFAVRENRIDVAKFLLENGGDPLSLAVNDSLLEICRDRGYADMEKLLMAEFARRFGASVKGEVIAAAIRERSIEKVRSLLDASPELIHAGDERSNQPIHWAVMTRQIGMIDEILARGADINAKRFDGARPIQLTNGDYHYRGWRDVPESSADALSIAMDRGNEKMVELLCSFGAARSVDLLSHYGDVRAAAAMFAVNPALADDPQALGQAAENGHEAFVRLMLHYQPDLVSRVSVGAKTRELTEWLFARGMNPNLPDWLGVTRLHEFARRGDIDKAAIFIDHGADLHARDEDIRSTPLGWAAKFGQTAMVELLLSRGATPNRSDDPPWATPLAWANRRGHEEIANLLKRHGAA